LGIAAHLCFDVLLLGIIIFSSWFVHGGWHPARDANFRPHLTASEMWLEKTYFGVSFLPW